MNSDVLKRQLAPGQPWRTATGATVWVIVVTLVEMPVRPRPAPDTDGLTLTTTMWDWEPTVRYSDGSGIEYVQPLSRFFASHTYAGVTTDG